MVANALRIDLLGQGKKIAEALILGHFKKVRLAIRQRLKGAEFLWDQVMPVD
jgi:hypothetical protein